MEQQRQFKGIWIPAEIWLEENLTMQEKILLVEIDSLENENGCYASNKYFSNFFKLSNGRISQLISSLEEKGYLKVDYKYIGKEIEKRIIHINKPPYPEVFSKLNTCLENDNGGIKFSKEGYLENAKENNIKINNINNNISLIDDLWNYIEKNYINLNPIDYEKINALLEEYTYDEIIKAVDIAKEKGGCSIQYVSKILKNPKKTQNKNMVVAPSWLDMDLSHKEEDEWWLTDEDRKRFGID